MTTLTHTADIQTETRPVSDSPLPEPANYSPPKPMVLLAEDEPIVREYMATLLREQGYRVVKAGDGEEALGIFKQIPGMMIDLLLTDIIMPKMNGKELAHRIGLLSPGTKVMFCSAYPETLASRNGMIDTRIPFLQKPVTPEVLAARVRAILEEPQEALPDDSFLDEEF
jgi:two-component system cell cycle sensor histidine kinase/response regulator CckA